MLSSQTKGVIFVVSSAFCYGLMPLVVKHIYAAGVSVVSTITVRFLIAFFALGAFLLVKDRALLRTDKTKASAFLFLGVSYFAVIGLTLAALKFAPTAVVIPILYTYPILIFLYKVFFGKTPFRLSFAAFLLGALLGMALLLGASFSGANLLGTGIAFLAAVSFACYVFIGGKKVASESSLTISFYTYAVSCVLILLIYMNANGASVHPIPDLFGWFFLLGVVTTVMPNFLFLKGLRYIETTKAATLAMLEPLFAILLAVLFAGETLTAVQACGGALLLASSLAVAFRGK